MSEHRNILFVGTYSPADQDGIHVLSCDPETGRVQRLSSIGGIENPSYLAVHPDTNRLYAVSETADNGFVVAYQFDPVRNVLVELNRQPTGGGYPCHLSLDIEGAWLFSVNYMSGSVCLFPIREDGAILPLSDQIQHAGGSIHPDRQEGPHPHSIVNIPNTDFWLVPDLGTDQLYVYHHDKFRGKLKLQAGAVAEPGAGPRHVAFHPSMPMAYIINELNSTITAYRYERHTGSLTLLQTVSTFPVQYMGENACADIHISLNGEYLYGSNRGHDSITVFKVLQDGCLEQSVVAASGGKTPRNFALDPSNSFLLAANQDSDSIVTMKLNDRGIPESTGYAIELFKPVCLKFYQNY
ncbi:lactonase family protein [Paenibacillus sp. UNC451MF]|uniref:lactonase family protein n=1 Tax=Paenibacillus sp. UNC451MF TaxID=1449063 RepID=UPI00048AAA11|nr:lactonase family protein [Paenibacillus sp. UNC451MF]